MEQRNQNFELAPSLSNTDGSAEKQQKQQNSHQQQQQQQQQSSRVSHKSSLSGGITPATSTTTCISVRGGVDVHSASVRLDNVICDGLDSDAAAKQSPIHVDITKRKQHSSIHGQHGHGGHIHHHEIGNKLKEELSKYKQELKEYNATTKDLEEKYMKINFELNEIQQKHDHFVANRKCNNNNNNNNSNGNNHNLNNCNNNNGCTNHHNDSESYYDSCSSLTSEVTLQHKHTHVYRRGSSFMTMLSTQTSNDHIIDRMPRKYAKEPPLPVTLQRNAHTLPAHAHTQPCDLKSHQHKRQLRKKRRTGDIDNRENDPHINSALPFLGGDTAPVLKDMYNVLKNVIDAKQQHQQQQQKSPSSLTTEHPTVEMNNLYSAITNLKNEQVQYRHIIRQQQDCINDYHSRCVKAQEIMKTQKTEIEKLNSNNKQLETHITEDIDELRTKIDGKLKAVAHLPELMREEHAKYERAVRENALMTDKLHGLQTEAHQLKIKIDELGKRKLVTINRLKAAERDLKIFKNYNTSLKMEKRRLGEELTHVREQLETIQAAGKRSLARHRDQSEKQRRELQKRIFDLELKLSRSQNSTTGLIQERDSLITELQTQLHTLVHNFEVSQKHIRVLRRHIYSMSAANGGGGGGVAGGGNTCAGGVNSNIHVANSGRINVASSGRSINSRIMK